MAELTYRYLGEDAAVLVGQPFGMDSERWPWQVVAVRHNDDRTKTHVQLEPYPMPEPGENAEDWKAHAVARASMALGAPMHCASSPFTGSVMW